MTYTMVSTREIASMLIWALVVSGTIALVLSLIPRLNPDRKGFFNRVGYCCLNYGLPAWFVIEAILWLATRRWVP